MTGADPLAEAVRLLGKLVVAAAAPARRDAAMLRDDAPRVRAQLEAARLGDAGAKEPVWLAWLDWLPWVGGQWRGREALTRPKLADAQQEWQGVRMRAQAAADVLSSVAEAEASLRRVRRAAGRGLQPPPASRQGTEMLLARVRFLAATDGKDARFAPQLARRCLELAQQAESLAGITGPTPTRPAGDRPPGTTAVRKMEPASPGSPAPVATPMERPRTPIATPAMVIAAARPASPPVAAPGSIASGAVAGETTVLPAARSTIVGATPWQDASRRGMAAPRRRRGTPSGQLSLDLGTQPTPPMPAGAMATRAVPAARPGVPPATAEATEAGGEPRIWLPVSPSRMHEVLARGARLDRAAPRRGSQLWVPVSERHAVESFLPLAFRREATRFSFPPIRHGASGQNLWSLFDRDNWNHIRTTCYDRAGHRCQICGKQGGGLWSRITPEEERARRGVVDCHEVWDWQVTDPVAGTGVQRLQRMLCLCKDCHAIFHEGFTLSKAREAGIEAEAADYIRARRMLVNRCDGAGLDRQLAEDGRAWAETSKVGHWVLDLSHLAAQDYMADRVLTLNEGNAAEIGPDQIGGIAFRTADGTSYAATDARTLASGTRAQPVMAPAGLRL